MGREFLITSLIIGSAVCIGVWQESVILAAGIVAGLFALVVTIDTD